MCPVRSRARPGVAGFGLAFLAAGRPVSTRPPERSDQESSILQKHYTAPQPPALALTTDPAAHTFGNCLEFLY